MRTTLTIDDPVLQELKKIAHNSGKSLRQVVNETLQRGLQHQRTPTAPQRYRLKTVSMGGPQPGVNLNKALRLADVLEDQELHRKLELRK
jgi:hypothetical protein